MEAVSDDVKVPVTCPKWDPVKASERLNVNIRQQSEWRFY